MEGLALVVFCLAGLVIVYHHIGYPFILKMMTQGLENTLPAFYRRHYQITPLDHMLPSISLIMPAHNEAGTIQEKIRNLAALDYPAYKLKVILFVMVAQITQRFWQDKLLQSPSAII